MVPLCADQGVGLLPWSPLARGKLTRPWGEETTRTQSDNWGRQLYPDSDRTVVDVVGQVAERRGVTRAQVALAWLMAQPQVSSPIVGVTKPHHLTDAVAAVDLELTADEMAELEAPYEPHAVSGHGPATVHASR